MTKIGKIIERWKRFRVARKAIKDQSEFRAGYAYADEVLAKTGEVEALQAEALGWDGTGRDPFDRGISARLSEHLSKD